MLSIILFENEPIIVSHSNYSLIPLPVGHIVVFGDGDVSTKFVVVIIVDDNTVLLLNITTGTTIAAVSIPNPTMIPRIIRRNRVDLTRLFK